jgi:ATP-binding cassette subfamily C (CFTR/MRP) protein 1
MDLEAKAPLCSHFLETLAGIMTIRAFGWKEKYRQQSNECLDRSQVPFYLLFAIQNWLKLVLELMVAGLVTVVVGVAVALRSKVDAGYLGLALVGTMDLGFSITYLVTSWTDLETSLSAVSRIRHFATETPREEEENNSIPPPVLALSRSSLFSGLDGELFTRWGAGTTRG